MLVQRDCRSATRHAASFDTKRAALRRVKEGARVGWLRAEVRLPDYRERYGSTPGIEHADYVTQDAPPRACHQSIFLRDAAPRN